MYLGQGLPREGGVRQGSSQATKTEDRGGRDIQPSQGIRSPRSSAITLQHNQYLLPVHSLVVESGRGRQINEPYRCAGFFLTLTDPQLLLDFCLSPEDPT